MTDTNHTELKVDLRPTLFIGAGGTGLEVLLRIRRRILSAVWNPRQPVRLNAIGQFPAARFLHLDLDSNAVVDDGKSRQADPWFEQVRLADEERLVETLDLAQYHESDDSLARFPLIEQWMPLRPRKMRTLGIDPAQGAGQIRALARLYLFDKYPRLRARIKSALNALGSNAGVARKEEYARLGLQVDTSRFRVVVIASNAGGTGAGTALDLGWLAKAIARQEVPESQVDLVMLMPSGFARANQERTEANAYATLMELETAMRDMDANLRWADPDSLAGRGTPFDDVYLVDNANLANKATDDLRDVYQMVADTLFEDLASADFASRKRSVAVNQQQHKLGPFNPRVPEQRFGDMRLSYSKAYSAFGQSVLDTQQHARADIRAYQLAGLMVKAFFGLAGSDTAARRAGDHERDSFMREQLGMADVPFTDFPDFRKGTVDTSPFGDVALTGMLLQDAGGRSLLERAESRVQLELDRIMASYAPKDWRERVAELVPQLERDAIREAGAAAETGEDRIKHRALDLGAAFRERARAQLFALLDDRRQGGLEFVLSLLEQVKARYAQRDLPAAERNARRYREVRDALRTRQLEDSLNRLGQAARGFFARDTNAREVMAHLKRDIADYLRFHLLSVGAAQGAEVMRSVSAWLGEPQAPDAQGQVQWSGVAGEFQEGRRCVRAMLGAVDRRLAQLRADAGHDHATCLVLGAEDAVEPVRLTGDVAQWSAEVLLEFGGSAQLFAQLAAEQTRAQLLHQLLRRAQAQLGQEELGRLSRPDPLLERLAALTPPARQRLFGEWIRSAMPWLNARFQAEFTPHADQFKCFVGVGDVAAWKRLEPEIRAAVPAGFFPGDRVSVVATGLPGRAVCYVELSGIPLTVLRGLPAWRTAYQLENPKIPTHLHFDATRFRHPAVPSMDELHRLADDFELFLQAQALGLLRRRGDQAEHEAAFQPAGQYLFEVEQGSGEWLQIGNERAIRANGLPSWYRERIAEAVRRRMADIGPWRLLLLVALMRFTQHRVYAPRLDSDETGAQQPAPSLPHVCAGRVAAQWQERLRMLDPALGAAELERAGSLLAQWSEPVPGSAADVHTYEVQGRMDKRGLRADMAASEERAAAVFAPTAPALLGARYKLFADGRQQGPFALDELAARVAGGTLARATLVWNMAWDPRSAKWRAAGLELAGLFEQVVPDPDDGIPDPQ